VTAAVDPRAWAAPKPSALHRFLPVTAWLPGYDYRRLLRFDAIAGATVWGLLVPEMIAYAGLAGLPPQAGLYTLLATLAAYAIFGTSRHVIVAGTSAAAVLLASTVGDVAVSHDDYLANSAALVLIVGGLFLLAGVLRLGFIAQFMSRPVVEGFVFGLAIFVTVKQLPKLFGIPGGTGDTIRQFAHVVTHLGETSGATLIVGASALTLLFGIERFAPKVPGGLLALALGILLSSALHLSNHGVAIVGKVPSGLPSVGVPSVPSENITTLLAAAGGMLLVIFSESLGAAQIFATKHGYEIDPNQELIALGVANAGSGFVGGLAAGGSLSQSAVNEAAGARSEASALVAALLMIVTVLVLTPVFTNLPEAVLAALIIHAVSHLWKIKAFRRYYAERRIEFLLGLATLLGVITIDVLPGLIIGVISMLLLVVYNASRPHLAVLARTPGTPGAFGDIARHPDYETIPGLLVLRADSALFYANATLFRDRVKYLVGASNPLPKAVVLDIGVNDELDITTAETLEELVKVVRAAGIDFAFAEVRGPVIRRMQRESLFETIGEDRIFPTVDEAIDHLQRASDVTATRTRSPAESVSGR
jgi:SulP family sulfate permease